MYASLALETLNLSVTGIITEPTVRQLNPSSMNISTPRRLVAIKDDFLFFRFLYAHSPYALVPPLICMSLTTILIRIRNIMMVRSTFETMVSRKTPKASHG